MAVENPVDVFIYGNLKGQSLGLVEKSTYLQQYVREFYWVEEEEWLFDYSSDHFFQKSKRSKVLKTANGWVEEEVRLESLVSLQTDRLLRAVAINLLVQKRRFDLISVPQNKTRLESRAEVGRWLFLELFYHDTAAHECLESLRSFFADDEFLRQHFGALAEEKVREICIKLFIKMWHISTSNKFGLWKVKEVIQEIRGLAQLSDGYPVKVKNLIEFIFAPETQRKRIVSEQVREVLQERFLVRKKNFVAVLLCLLDENDKENLCLVLFENMDLADKLFNSSRGCEVGRKVIKRLMENKKKNAAWNLGRTLLMIASERITKTLRGTKQFAEFYFARRRSWKKGHDCIICFEEFKDRDLVVQCQDCKDSRTHRTCFIKSKTDRCFVCRRSGGTLSLNINSLH